MKSNAYTSRISLGFSKYLFGLFLLIYFGAGISLWSSSVWNEIKMLGTALLLIQGLVILRRDIWLVSLQSTVEIEYDDIHWKLYKKSGEMCLTRLSPHSIRTPYFLLLHFQDVLNQRRYFVFILPDMLPKDTFRHLKATLAVTHG